MARQELGKDDDEPEADFDFTGFPLPAAEALELFGVLRRYRILPFAGGWMDQPEQYRQSMTLCSRLYNDAVRRVLAEGEQQTPTSVGEGVNFASIENL